MLMCEATGCNRSKEIKNFKKDLYLHYDYKLLISFITPDWSRKTNGNIHFLWTQVLYQGLLPKAIGYADSEGGEGERDGGGGR